MSTRSFCSRSQDGAARTLRVIPGEEDSRMFMGTFSRPISPVRQSTTMFSTQLRSSRMLPGHFAAQSAAMAGSEMVMSPLPFSSAIRERNPRTRIGMSEVRSRSGGIRILTTFRR